jgi:ribosome-binding factor A
MAKARLRRIEAELQRTLAELIRRDVKDPRVGNVTLTAVSLAPDLSLATVYFVPFGAQHSVDEVATGLGRAAGFLRGEVSRSLGLRHAPKLEFRFDESLQRAHDISELIDSAVKRDQASHHDD